MFESLTTNGLAQRKFKHLSVRPEPVEGRSPIFRFPQKGKFSSEASNPSLTRHVLSQAEGGEREDFSPKQARRVSGSWAALDHKAIMPVFLPAVFVMFGAHGEFLPVADGGQSLRGDP